MMKKRLCGLNCLNIKTLRILNPNIYCKIGDLYINMKIIGYPIYFLRYLHIKYKTDYLLFINKSDQMKRKLLLTIVSLLCASFIFAQTAVDFNVNDCSSRPHHLFGELDAGKVVVIAFVDPCASCIAPSGTALGIVQGYASSNPGRVIYYLADDLAKTICSTLKTWAVNKGITGVPVFSDPAVIETDYGTGGMPKIVVLAGTSHSVLFTQNGGLNSTNFTNAINQGLVTGIEELDNSKLNLNVYPTPAFNNLTVNFNLKEKTNVRFDIYNIVGSAVKSIEDENTTTGNNKTTIPLESLPNGIYFLKLTTGESSYVVKFTVSK